MMNIFGTSGCNYANFPNAVLIKAFYSIKQRKNGAKKLELNVHKTEATGTIYKANCEAPESGSRSEQLARWRNTA